MQTLGALKVVLARIEREVVSDRPSLQIAKEAEIPKAVFAESPRR
jgi:hypothetical protein